MGVRSGTGLDGPELQLELQLSDVVSLLASDAHSLVLRRPESLASFARPLGGIINLSKVCYLISQ
jgi:hypothetical protein